jgi:hypothetical protein
MSFRVITHYGKAHMDELLAISLISIHKKELPSEIVRMNPQEAAILAESGNYSNDTYFIDCSLVHDSNRNMFDHHQDNDSPCSALLVFEHFFPELEDSDLHDYIKLVSKIDTRGIKSIDDFETANESRIYFSFSQKILLKYFEENPLAVIEIFQKGIEGKIEFAEKRKAASEWLSTDGNIKFSKIDGIKVIIYINRPPLDLCQAVRAEDSLLIDQYQADAIYSFDENREDVRTLFRTNHGYESVDFSRSEVSETVFCHKGGFLLKFVPGTDDEWIDVIKQSVLCPSVC